MKASFAISLLAALAACTASFAAPPKVTRLFPAGGQRGTTVEVSCAGDFETWPVSVWSPGVIGEPLAEKGKLKLTIPADLPADRVWLRLYNAEGATPPLPFLVGGLAEAIEKEPNNTVDAAHRLDLAGATANGVLEGADVDCFLVEAAAGQTLVADLDAHGPLGSPMDAVLQIVTPAGTVLAENHDDVGLDPRITYEVKHSGPHIVRLFSFSSEPNTSIAYQGGPNYVYRLTMTTGPFIAGAASSAVASGDMVRPLGWNLPADLLLAPAPFGGEAFAEHLERDVFSDTRIVADAKLGYLYAPGLGGGARLRLTPHPATPELVVADAASPAVLALPLAITGRFDKPRQVDAFRLPMKAGQQACLAVEALGLESPVHPMLRLVDPSGKSVYTFEDAAPLQPANPAATVAFTAAVDGDYSLSIQDRFDQHGERCLYRLTARIEQPDFELSLGGEDLTVSPDKPAEVVVNVVRRAVGGANVGPITIAAVGLPEGVAAPPVISLSEGETAAKVTLKFTSTGAAFSGPIRISGSCTEPQPLSRLALTPPKLGARFASIWLTSQ